MDFFHMSIEHRTFVSWRHYFENSGIKFLARATFSIHQQNKSRLFFRLVKKSNLFSHGETIKSFFTSEKINSFFTDFFSGFFSDFCQNDWKWPNSARFTVFSRVKLDFFLFHLLPKKLRNNADHVTNTFLMNTHLPNCGYSFA